MSRSPVAAFLSGLLLLIQQAPARAGDLSIDARRLRLQQHKVQADGSVRLQLGRCMLEANSLRLTLGEAVDARQARLAVGRIRLTAYRLRIRQRALDADWVAGSLWACEGSTPLLSLSARRGWVSPGGRRLHLKWPALRVNTRTLIKLPYWFLPLRPGVSGLLPPQIGWSGRDGVRWEQGGYWALSQRLDLRITVGWIHGRGPRGQLTWRYFTEEHGDGELSVRGLEDQGWWRGSIRGRLMFKGQGWSAGVIPDLVSDGAQPIQLDHEADRIFSPYLRSRIWNRIGGETLVGAVSGDLFTQIQAPARREQALHEHFDATLGLMPIQLAGPLLLLGTLDVSSWSGGGAYFTSLRESQGEDYPMAVSQLRFRPVVALAQRLGPLRVSGKAAYYYAGVWAPQVRASGWSLTSIQGGTLALEGSVPLERIFVHKQQRILHRLEPLAAWRWSGSDAPDHLMPDGTALWTGHRFMAGLRTRVMSRMSKGPVRRWGEAQVLVELPLAWPNVDYEVLKPVFGGTLSIGPLRRMQLVADLRYLPTEARVAKVGIRGCAQWGGLRPCAGYLHARLDHLAEGLTDDGDRAWMAPDAMGSLPLDLQLDQITGGLSWRWSPLSIMLQAAVDPAAARLTQISYSIEWTFGCGCYQLELRGRSWAGSGNHHLMLGLRLLPGAVIACE